MFRKSLKLFCCAIGLLQAIPADLVGQIKSEIERYSTGDGLSHNRILSIIKDREGFMWFGTWDGLNRFDGHNFVVYKSRPGDSSNLRSNRIQNIVEDYSGFLWLRTYDNRVYRFDKAKEEFLGIIVKNPSSGGKEIVYDRIVLSKAGHIWLTTKNQGIFLISNPAALKPKIVRFAAGNIPPLNLPSNNIDLFHEDNSSNIWIATERGMSCLKRDKAGRYTTAKLHPAILKLADVVCAGETDKSMWFGTKSGTVISEEKSNHAILIKKISNYSLNGVCVSLKTDQIYWTTQGGEVISVNRKSLQAISCPSQQKGPFYRIYEDRTGRLWIEPQRYGIFKFDPLKKAFRYYEQKVDGYYDHVAKFFKVFEDKVGRVWISMQNGGFGYYNPEADSVSYFHNKPGSKDQWFSNIVIGSYLDSNGTLWLTADDKGLNKIVFQPNYFKHQVLVENSFNRSDNEIRGVLNDHKGRLWLASKSCHIFVYKDGQPVHISFLKVPKEGLGMVYSLIEDKSHSIWLGTKGNGLFKAEPVDAARRTYKITQFLADKSNRYSLSSNNIYSLLQDKKGRIWIGTFESGFNLIENKNDQIRFLNIKNVFKNFPSEEFIKIRNLKEDAEGRIWVASTDGLLVFDPDKGSMNKVPFVTYNKVAGDKTSLGKNDIQYLFKDSKNSMWLCTSGGGLNKAIGRDPFKQLRFKSYTTDNGLTSDYVLSCTEDKRGNLWLATENGLSKFNPRAGKFRNYDSYDGLPKNGFSESSVLNLFSGELVFGAITGYVTFDPNRISNHRVEANMVFTNLQVNNRDVLTKDKSSLLLQNINRTKYLKLAYNQNIISIDYAVLDYRLTNKQSYAYRMLGFDKEWQDNKSQHRATYTNLPPGDYTFEVHSTNSESYINSPYKKLEITIVPPFWLSWWAYIIYFIVAAIVVEIVRRTMFTMVRLRHRIVLESKMSEMKMAFFTNVSHELRTPLTLILNPIEHISRNERLSAEGVEYIRVVKRNAGRMVRFINQLLDLRKVQSGKAILRISRVEIVSFVTDISRYFNDVALEKNITVTIKRDAEEIYAWIDAEKIDIVVYNVLANAFKFTPPKKEVSILVSTDAGCNVLHIEVIDQGAGVYESELKDIFGLYYEGNHGDAGVLKGTGIGLALSKELVKLHHGSIYAKNNVEGGLIVTIELALGKVHLSDDAVFVDLPEVPNGFDETVQNLISSQHIVPSCVEDENLPLVLLVEDNNDLRMFLKQQLSQDYQIETAEDGADGLEKSIQLLPDLILSDVMMPRMDGIQMLDQLKNNPVTSHIPVVLLTAKFSIANQIEGLKYGADFYITKPFDNDILLASVESLLKQRRRIFESLLSNVKTVSFSPGEISITSQDEIFIRRVISIVENHLADPEFNIDTVAESLNMGRSTFNKKFKSLTNLRPVEVVREIRLKRAKQYFDAGEKSIADVAYRSGFNNTKYFSTCFKEYFECSPAEYVKSRSAKV